MMDIQTLNLGIQLKIPVYSLFETPSCFNTPIGSASKQPYLIFMVANHSISFIQSINTVTFGIFVQVSGKQPAVVD